MKKTALITALSFLGVIAAQAGPAKAPVVQPTPPAPTYGVGPYLAIQGGVNAYQSYEGSERHTINGVPVTLEANEKVGGFGGIKWGYGWDGQTVKPALELDAFYNGVDVAIDGRTPYGKFGTVNGRLDTGAILLNGLLRFDTGSAFMPYVGLGAGVWIGQVDDMRITGDDLGSVRVSNNDTNADLAVQLLAGFDYFFSSNMSFFMEYKYLNYFGVDLPADDPIQQHLFGIGVKWFY